MESVKIEKLLERYFEDVNFTIKMHGGVVIIETKK